MESSPPSEDEFGSWDDVRAELAALGPPEQLARAKRELRAYLRAYRLAETGWD